LDNLEKFNTDNFVMYKTQDGLTQIELYEIDGDIWLNQEQIAELFNTTKQNIGRHLKNCFKDGELDINSVVKYYFITARDNKNYKNAFYNLEAILAVAFRVRSNRGVQFRNWANTTLQEYLKKGFVIDDKRLKNLDGRPDYFDELLEQIRDIRASEKRFYQKIRDLFRLSIDYDSKVQATNYFFAEVQNKLLYAVTGYTAAELILSRADSTKPNMALTSWSGEIVRKNDIYIAKNYLLEAELSILNRLVTAFLEIAELRVSLKKTLTLDFWKNSIDKLLSDNELSILVNNGSISNEVMREKVSLIYAEFDKKRIEYNKAIADEEDFYNLTGNDEQSSIDTVWMHIKEINKK